METVTCVVDSRSEIGEGAVWDSRIGRLWWVDIPKGRIYCFDPETGENASHEVGEPVGSLAPRAGGGLVIATKSGFHRFDPATGTKEPIQDPEAHLPKNRFNDGGTDRQGRFWAGTMQEEKPQPKSGTFYRLDPDLSVSVGPQPFYTTNGLAFSPDGTRMYVADTHADIRTIWVYDYDTATGTPHTPRVFFDMATVGGRPDGGTVDVDGCYWAAGIDGWHLVRIRPDGTLDRTVPLPIQRPSKPMWGGPRLDTLYVTSLGIGLEEGRAQPQAGSLFAVTGLGTHGLAEAPFAG